MKGTPPITLRYAKSMRTPRGNGYANRGQGVKRNPGVAHAGLRTHTAPTRSADWSARLRTRDRLTRQRNGRRTNRCHPILALTPTVGVQDTPRGPAGRDAVRGGLLLDQTEREARQGRAGLRREPHNHGSRGLSQRG
jgi:hypothetical protein